MDKMVKINKQFSFVGSDCTLLEYTGTNGSGLFYFDEFDYVEKDEDFTRPIGERALTREEVAQQLKSVDGKTHFIVFEED